MSNVPPPNGPSNPGTPTPSAPNPGAPFPGQQAPGAPGHGAPIQGQPPTAGQPPIQGQPPTAPTGKPAIPTSVKAIRVMLWILVGAAALMVIGGALLAENAREAGQLLASPIIIGIPALVLALLSTRRSKGVWIGLIVFESFMILLALGQLSSQGGRTLITLAIHITVLVLVLRRSARTYYRGGSGSDDGQPPSDPHHPHGVHGQTTPPQPPQAF